MSDIEDVREILVEFRLKLEHIKDPYITKWGYPQGELIDRFVLQICYLIEQARQKRVDEIWRALERRWGKPTNPVGFVDEH